MEGGDNIPPKGLNVLVVDDNPTCLKVLERLLEQCQYNVTITTEAVIALEMMREDKDKFDIVISDVHMPGMSGFGLLEHIGLELDLPVIMLSANDDSKLVMKGVLHGAVDYLVKPVRVAELQNIWQHVVRWGQAKKNKGRAVANTEAREDGSVPAIQDENNNTDPEEKKKKKKKDEGDSDSEEEEEESENTDPATKKKPRVVWSAELHRKFVAAVDQLGERAFPKKILTLMNTEGLTRANVASHLQKYKLYLKRINSPSTQPIEPTLPYGTLSNPYAAFTSLSSVGNSTTAIYRPGLAQNHNVAIPRLMEMVSFQQQNNTIRPIGMPPTTTLQSREGLVNSQPSVVLSPHLADYTARLESWQSINTAGRSPSQQNLLNNNGSFGGADVLCLQSAFQLSSLNGQGSVIAQNVGFGIGPQRWEEQTLVTTNISSAYSSNPLVPAIGSSNQVFVQDNSAQVFNNFDPSIGQASGSGTTGFMQDIEAQQSELDYIIDETDLLAEFTQNGGGSLEDIVGALPK